MAVMALLVMVTVTPAIMSIDLAMLRQSRQFEHQPN